MKMNIENSIKYVKDYYNEVYELFKSLFIGVVSITGIMVFSKLLNFIIFIFNSKSESNIKVLSIIDE